MDKTDQPNSNLDELTTKRGQSSVSVSYSPPSPHTFMPYDLPKIWPNRQNKYLTMLGGCGELHDIEEKLRIRGKKKKEAKAWLTLSTYANTDPRMLFLCPSVFQVPSP